MYYVQYAHARICSLVSRLTEEGAQVPGAAAVDASLFTTAEEKALIKTLSQLPEVIRISARDYDPSHVNRYLITLAGDFHRFYNACRIKGEEAHVLSARLKLADTVRSVIANCLALIGVTAPEKMEKPRSPLFSKRRDLFVYNFVKEKIKRPKRYYVD